MVRCAPAQMISRLSIVLFVAFSCASCVSFTWQRTLAFEPVSENAVSSLQPGTTDLSEVLAKLGAPIYVWEGKDRDVVLAYGSLNEKELGFRVSVPVFDRTSASLNYDDAASKLEGYILVFDSSDKLKIVRAGLLRDLSKIVRARPATVE